jgi:excisionase family DNA binding protein
MAQELTSEPTPPSDEVLLMRAEAVARTLGLRRSKIYQMMSGGALPTVRVRRAERVPKAARFRPAFDQRHNEMRASVTTR